MTVQEFINKVRNRVGDANSNKYTDSRIIEIINEGLEDIGKKAYVRKKDLSIPVVPYQRKIVINDEDFIKLKRVRVANKEIAIKSFDYMDKNYGSWEEKIGSNLEVLIVDTQNPKELTLYPLLDETKTEYQSLNSSASLLIDIPNVESDTVYGLITSMEIENIVEPENVYNVEELAGYEPIISLSDAFIVIEVKYYATPVKVETTSDILDIDDSYTTTLLFYVAGLLLLDDNRTESVQRGQIFIQRYAGELQGDKVRNANSYQDVDYPEVEYRTGF